jgi:hypothetical protein
MQIVLFLIRVVCAQTPLVKLVFLQDVFHHFFQRVFFKIDHTLVAFGEKFLLEIIVLFCFESKVLSEFGEKGFYFSFLAKMFARVICFLLLLKVPKILRIFVSLLKHVFLNLDEFFHHNLRLREEIFFD